MFTNHELDVIRDACIGLMYSGTAPENKRELANKIAIRCEDFLLSNDETMRAFVSRYEAGIKG